MDYQTALKEIAKALADRTDSASILDAITNQVGNLNAESASRRHELSELIKLVEALKKAVGDDVDLIQFVSEAKKKINTETATTADLQAKLDAAIALAATEQRRYTLLKAAQLSNADEEALNKLLESVPTEKIVIDSEVKIDGKPLKEYAIGQAKFWESALFPNQNNGVPTGGKTAEQPQNPSNTYLQRQADKMIEILNKS